MKIGDIRGVSFKGSIIDSHMHLGNWVRGGNPEDRIEFKKESLDSFVNEPLSINIANSTQQDSVDKVLISNLDCFVSNGISDELKGNMDLLEVCKDNPKFYAMAACQPSKTGGNAVSINKLLQENPNKFVALKFHPRNFNHRADDSAYKNYMKLAERFKLPCLFHSDMNLDAQGNIFDSPSSPDAIYSLAKKHPNVPVIMGHLGAGNAKSHQHAIDILLSSIDNGDAKLYADISWVDWGQNGLSSQEKPSIVHLIKELQKRNATDRILFGTDAPLGCFGENPAGGLSPKQAYEKTVSDLKNVIKNNFKEQADELIEKIFHKNAEELFFKKDWAVVKNSVKNKTSVAKVLSIIGVSLVALTGLSYLKNKYFPKEEPRFNK